MTPESAEEIEYKHVKQLIAQIDADPEHKLPEGVDGLIKLAYITLNSLSGQIWYDRFKRFPDGEMITTSSIVEKCPNGIYKTRNSTYLVELIQPQTSQSENVPNGAA